MKPLSYREVINKARRAGFAFRRNTGGTHEIWWNEKRRKEIAPGTLKSIIRQMGLTKEEFNKL